MNTRKYGETKLARDKRRKFAKQATREAVYQEQRARHKEHTEQLLRTLRTVKEQRDAAINEAGTLSQNAMRKISR